MAGKANPVPEGFHTVTLHLTVQGAAKAVDFYKKAFGAEEIMRMPGPDGQSIMHAEIKIGNSIIMLNDEWPGGPIKSPASLKGTSTVVHLYVENVDAAFGKAAAAGCTPVMPVTNMFWGDRYGMLVDPFGHAWSIATHVEDVPPEEMPKRAAAAMAEMGKGCGG